MDVCFAVYDQALIVGQFFTPQFAAEMIYSPVVPVEATPENGTAVLVNKLFRSYRIVETIDVHLFPFFYWTST